MRIRGEVASTRCAEPPMPTWSRSCIEYVHAWLKKPQIVYGFSLIRNPIGVTVKDSEKLIGDGDVTGLLYLTVEVEVLGKTAPMYFEHLRENYPSLVEPSLVKAPPEPTFYLSLGGVTLDVERTADAVLVARLRQPQLFICNDKGEPESQPIVVVSE